MNVLVIQPGFPAEIPYFVRGLARKGATVIGVGDQPLQALPPVARKSLKAYLHVKNLWQVDALEKALREWRLPLKIDRIECLWEAAMELTAQLRRRFGVPGLTVEQTALFRDKNLMRTALDKAGVRNPKHAKAATTKEILQAAEYTGFPLIVKPVAGAGSAHTYRVDNLQQLQAIMPKMSNVRQVVVEEFVHGTEFTFETICHEGKILFYSIEWYRPDMLTARSQEWISPQTIILRDQQTPDLQKGYALGAAVLEAMKFRTGFTHMEWFLTPNGEAVFGEIAARPPGGNSGEMMNYSCDFDVYNAWAEALLKGKISQKIERKYNVAIVFKRAKGQGRIKSIQGLEDIRQKFGAHILREDLLPIGARRRDWKNTLLSDGFILLRHPDLAETTRMADYIGDHLVLHAE